MSGCSGGPNVSGGGGRRRSRGIGDQFWGRMMREVRRNGVAKILEDRTPLLVASGDDREDPFAPALTFFPTRSLGDPAMNGDEPNRLLGQVIVGSTPGVVINVK